MLVTRFAVALTLAASLAAPAFAQPAAAPAPDAAPALAQPYVAPAQQLAIAPAGDTIETLRAAGQFKTLLKALDAANLTGVIKAQRTVTLFAPTDAAFAALPAGELDRLLKDRAALQRLMMYHLINLPVDSTKLLGAKGPINTVAGSGLVLDGSADGVLKANTATVLAYDIKTTSGVLYVVDAVLTPEGAAVAMAPAPEPAAAEGAPGAP